LQNLGIHAHLAVGAILIGAGVNAEKPIRHGKAQDEAAQMATESTNTERWKNRDTHTTMVGLKGSRPHTY